MKLEKTKHHEFFLSKPSNKYIGMGLGSDKNIYLLWCQMKIRIEVYWQNRTWVSKKKNAKQSAIHGQRIKELKWKWEMREEST